MQTKTRMHSSRMRTTRSSSCWVVGLPQCMLGYTPQVWAWRPPRCGSGEPPGCGPGDTPQVWAWRPPRCGSGEPPGCGPGDTPHVWAWRPPRPDSTTSPLGVGLEDHPLLARPLNFPLGVGLETCKACCDTTLPGDLLQGMLGYHLQCMLGYTPCG